MTTRNCFIVLLLAAAGDRAPAWKGHEEKAPAPKTAADFEGGTPIPSGAMTIIIPWTGKQSIMCVGAKSIERQIAFIDFGTEENEAQTDEKQKMLLGSVTLDEKGSGTGSFIAHTSRLRSGDKKRDGYLMGGAWLDAENNPTLGFKATKMTKLKPTVWEVEGDWTMRGVSKKVKFFSNVRYVPEMKYLGKNIARMTGSFDINLKEFGMDNGTVGDRRLLRRVDCRRRTARNHQAVVRCAPCGGAVSSGRRCSPSSSPRCWTRRLAARSRCSTRCTPMWSARRPARSTTRETTWRSCTGARSPSRASG